MQGVQKDELLYVWGQGIYGTSLFFSIQFYCEPKIALKIKFF